MGLSVLSACTKQENLDVAKSTQAVTKPNIVLILADDLALMDFGVYGGEAQTPNIDQLAQSGTMFTNYHASPMCAPSRAMLMTGVDSHRTGVPNLPLFLPPEYQVMPGYSGKLNDEVETVANRLKRNGYKTYVTGKWHLGHSEETLPTKRGFDRSYILDSSGADNYEQRPYLPGQGKPPWYKDGQPIELPADFYSSRSLVNEMIGFMDEAKAESVESTDPFFAFLSFQAIHIPLQVPAEYTEKYIDTYAEGWEALKAKRFKRAKELNLVPPTAALGDAHPDFVKWQELSPAQQKYAAKSMAVNAGMIDAMDEHIGRYIDYLKANDQFENTIFIVTSDNGPEASHPNMLSGIDAWLSANGISSDYEDLGGKRTVTAIGPEFASAAAGPSAFFKFYAGEGGLRVPLIISGPSIPSGAQNDSFSFITDIAPSIVELANGDISENDDFDGRSIVPVLTGKADYVYGPNDPCGNGGRRPGSSF